MQNNPIDLLSTPSNLTDGTEIDILEKPDIRFFPGILPDHEQVFEELMVEFHGLDTTVRIEQKLGVRRTTANLDRRSPRLVPESLVRRIVDAGVGELDRMQTMTPMAAMLAGRLWALTGRPPDDIQLALYQDGRDFCSPHADIGIHLGPAPDNVVIGIFSFGVTRRINFYRMAHVRPSVDGVIDQPPTHSLELPAGSLCVMAGETQRHWLHEIPADESVYSPRMSVSCIYYQPTDSVDRPWTLMQAPRPRVRGAAAYAISRHVGPPEECFARWLEIRDEEGITSGELRSMIHDSIYDPLEAPDEEVDYTDYEAMKAREAKIRNERLAEVLQDVRFGPSLAMMSPGMQEFSFVRAKAKFGREKAPQDAPPNGVDPKIWVMAQRLIANAADDEDA